MAQPVRVLHVDDDADFAELARSFLEREVDRLEVESATAPEAGLNRLDAEEFDCVVSDYGMRSLDGLEFFSSVRAEHPEIPFILFTGKGSEEVASEAISAGVTDYIQKEPGRDVFKLLANRILDAAELHRSKANYQEIFEQSPDGIVIHDPVDGTMLKINSQYADLFGYEKSELVDAGLEAILPDEAPYTVESARERIREVVEDGPQTLEWPGVRKDGSRFWAEVHLRPVELHGRERVLAAVRDITERREYEEELEHARTRTLYALEATNSY
ncbi:MAG: PAS domain S-box protein, partial [Halobacteriales archaeon]